MAGNILIVLIGVSLTRQASRIRQLCGLGLIVLGAHRALNPLQRILDPPPWAIEPEKYERLAKGLPLDSADTVLDVGSGTGRSLVGIAPFLQSSTDLLALDVFDSRVILGNAAGLTRGNVEKAGRSVEVLRGDAGHLPIRPDTQDVVTMSRVLHDLPNEQTADLALSEGRRVISPDGALGVLEVPVTHTDTESDALAYWRDRVRNAGFAVREASWVEGYVLIHATPR